MSRHFDNEVTLATFIWVDGLIVLGTTTADCAQCAWNFDHTKYPEGKLAVMTADINSTGRCIRLRR